MADSLELAGKLDAMEAIKATTVYIDLYSTTDTVLSTFTGSSATFNVNQTTGQLHSIEAIEFTIGAEDVSKTASYVTINNVADQVLIRVDLELAVLLTTEGTATISIGDLTADL